MSDPVQIAIIAAIVGLVPSILSFLNGRQINKNHQESVAQVGAVKTKVDELEVNTNHKMDELTQALKGQFAAEGELKGRAAARADQKEDAKP